MEIDAAGNILWQCDARGVYLHSTDSARKTPDKNFQGFGRFLTGSKGEYYFRTIRPVPYPGRTPHIHSNVIRSDCGLRLIRIRQPDRSTTLGTARSSLS